MTEKLINTKALGKTERTDTADPKKSVMKKRESKKSLLPAGRTVKEKEDGHGLQKDRTGNL